MLRTDGLRRVFDHVNAPRAANGVNCIHGRGQPEKMYGHYRACSRGDGAFYFCRVNIESLRVYINKHGCRADLRDRAGRSNKSERRGDHFVAAADAQRVKRENQGVRAGSASNRVFAAGKRAYLFFKLRDFRGQE